VLYGCPKLTNKSFSFSTKVGSSIGPFAKGATIAATLFDDGATLPSVKSISFTTIPGDAKFSGIFILLQVQNYSKNIYEKGYLQRGNNA
jgi:hypothetical protein